MERILRNGYVRWEGKGRKGVKGKMLERGSATCWGEVKGKGEIQGTVSIVVGGHRGEGECFGGGVKGFLTPAFMRRLRRDAARASNVINLWTSDEIARKSHVISSQVKLGPKHHHHHILLLHEYFSHTSYNLIFLHSLHFVLHV